MRYQPDPAHLEHISQAGQALVDVARLLSTLPLCLAPRQPLTVRIQYITMGLLEAHLLVQLAAALAAF